jgi:hypothetical protein
MSATLLPPTKTFGARPPFKPPTVTTFDGGSEDSGQPRFRFLADSTEKLLKSVGTWPEESLAVLLRLLELRKSLIEEELGYERMFSSFELPPPVFRDLAPVEYLLASETDAVTVYLSLLDSLYESILKVRRKIGLLKDLLPPSEG